VDHADRYTGTRRSSTACRSGPSTGELVTDTEAVMAGFAASCYAASPTGGGGLSTPQEVAAFLHDYEEVRGQLSERERRAAAAAAAWILALNARWQAALIVHGVCDHATIALVHDHQEDYLSLSWHEVRSRRPPRPARRWATVDRNSWSCSTRPPHAATHR
jgi:hypothetical protein